MPVLTLKDKDLEECRKALLETGRSRLAAKLSKAAKAGDDLSSTAAAQLLGVASANTVKNWLLGGAFPGAYRTRGGHWRFPRSEVEAMYEQMAELRRKNAAKDLAPRMKTAEIPRCRSL